MRRSHVVGAFARILLALVLWGCVRQPVPGVGASRLFEGEGEVLGVDLERSSVTIRHGEIPGLMPPMAMPFTAASREILRGVKPGDKVRFKLEQKGKDVILIEMVRRGGGERP